jgi:hypothetical protein
LCTSSPGPAIPWTGSWRVVLCPLPLEYQAAFSQARLKSCWALPPWVEPLLILMAVMPALGGSRSTTAPQGERGLEEEEMPCSRDPLTCGEEVKNCLRGCRRLAPEAGRGGDILHPQVVSDVKGVRGREIWTSAANCGL